MPSNNKKKRSSRKKTEKHAAAASLANMEAWVRSGRMDAKGLSKSLPPVAQVLRDNSMQPDDVKQLI
eukprot:scaffold5715_cov166-Amphora_coffeaeformis.AAC.5